jgi:hypothetical protein
MTERFNPDELEQQHADLYTELIPAMNMKIESRKIECGCLGCGSLAGLILACKLLQWGAEHNDDFWNAIYSIEEFITK